jgi:3-phosphoshikimate 1-carboxyvinyltransferase
VPTSKSLTNRALIAAAVAGGGTIIDPLDCDDTRNLASALVACGWQVSWDHRLHVGGRRVPPRSVRADLGDSGTGARFMLGLLAGVPGTTIVDGSARLRERPMGPLVGALEDLGADIQATAGGLPVALEGRVLEGGDLMIRPEVSSQFVSALLLAAPLMTRGLELRVDGDLPSGPYVDLTVDVLREFGCQVKPDPARPVWSVPAGPLRAATMRVEGDWSAAAFFLAAVAVAGGSISIGPLERTSRQGDRAIVAILENAGLDISWHCGRMRAVGPITRPFAADLSDTPDLFPALAAAAATVGGGSRLTGLTHLVHKESDRLSAMVDNLVRLGAEIEIEDLSVRFTSATSRCGGPPREVCSADDHRIAMAMAVAALAAGPAQLDDESCVTKSFPAFWNVWDGLLESNRSGSQ